MHIVTCFALITALFSCNAAAGNRYGEKDILALLGKMEYSVVASTNKEFAILTNTAPEVMPILIRILNQEQHETKLRVHAAIVIGIASYHKPGSADSAVSTLKQCLTQENDAVRTYCAQAAGVIGTNAWPCIPALSNCVVTSKFASLRISAIYALGGIGGASSPTLPLLEACANEDEPDIRITAMQAIAKIRRQ